MKNTSKVFRETMIRCEKTLTVGLIATPDPVGCTLADKAGTILGNYDDFDQFPVTKNKDNKEVIGVLERRNADPNRTVEEQLDRIRLRGGVIVASDEPLERIISAFVKQPYFLVVQGREINAIVTRSDLVKLPVQLLAFTVVTHLEQIMAQVIRKRFGVSEEWLGRLDEYSQKRLKKLKDKLKTQRSNPDLLDLTYFPEKVTILGSGVISEQDFLSNFDELHQLRNAISHARDFIGKAKPTMADSEGNLGELHMLSEGVSDLSDFIGNEESLRIFDHRMSLARKWIDRLSASVNDEPAT